MRASERRAECRDTGGGVAADTQEERGSSEDGIKKQRRFS